MHKASSSFYEAALHSWGLRLATGFSHPVYFVYGNHGDAPTQLEDYQDLFEKVMGRVLGVNVSPSYYPVPGAVNLLVEAFNPEWVRILNDVKKQQAGTKLICVATEFLTGDTFNNFSDTPFAVPERPSWLGTIAPVVFPKRIRAITSAATPVIYNRCKSVYYRLAGHNSKTVNSEFQYENRHFWKMRFRAFLEVAGLFDFVWCVSEFQEDSYANLLGEKRVRWVPPLPYGSTKPTVGNIEPYSNDFVFTGIINDRRREILNSLSKKGFRVAWAPYNFPSNMREGLINSSAVALNIKQKSEWNFHSNMRLDYLLKRGKVVVSEFAPKRAYHSDFVVEVADNAFIEKCIEVRKNLNAYQILSDRYLTYSKTLIEDTITLIGKDFGQKLELLEPSLSHH